MARLPRLTLVGHVHHVVLRGNNGQAIFLANTDYQRLLDLLFEQAHLHEVLLHAYVLMENHLHLLLTPQKEKALPNMMQAVGRSYVRWFNKIYQRTGTLWEGRYRSTLLQPDPYLLLCMVYLDNHPLRNQVVEKLSDYPWSSYHHYTGQRNDHRITPHAIVWGLGNTPFAREATYTELVQKGIATELQKTLRDTVLHGWILGDAAFKNFLQTQTQRRLSKAKPGRPRTPKNAAS